MISTWQSTSPRGASPLSSSSGRVLITGASGFIGGHLARRLELQGREIAGLVRPKSSTARLESPQMQLRRGDVTDIDSLRAAVADVDVVYHLAGVVKAVHYADYTRVNEQGVANLLKVCAERTTPPTVVLVSSMAAAGPAVGELPKLETEPAAPVSRYGRSKRAGELVAEQFADRVPITIVRPPIVFGEYDDACLNLFRPIRRFGIHLVPGFRTRRVSLIHADDLAAMLLLAADRGQRLAPLGATCDPSQGYYFAADSEMPSVGEMGRIIGEACGCRMVWVVPAPEAVAWCIGASNELVSRLRNTPSIVNLDKIREATAGSWICSVERARQELGFQVQHSLRERFRQTAEFYLNAGWMR